MNIYLLRHAQTEGNKEERFYGIKNTPLSKEGKASLAVVHKFFKNISLDKIYCSPMQRCIDTAKLSFGEKADIKIEKGLIELDFGDWEGQRFTNVMEKHPQLWAQYKKDWGHFCFPNGDTVPEYQARVQRMMAEILEKTDNDGTIALVSHYGFIKTALSYLLMGDGSLNDRISIQNATISWVDITNGVPKLRWMNGLQRF